MGDTTGIAWTDATFNPWIGCQRVSPGCEHCYAEAQANFRTSWGVTWGPNGNRRMASEDMWRKPLTWNRAAQKDGVRRKVFCASLADVFEEGGRWPELQNGRARLFHTIERTPWLDWQLLTKRPQNIMRLVPATWEGGFPSNVWIGATVEDQTRADERIPELLKIPARVRFLSCEPLLGSVQLGVGGEFFDYGFGRNDANEPRIHWVIVGGESGGGARPFELAWARSIVAHCKAAGVAVMVKQLGALPVTGVEATGNFRTHHGKRQFEMRVTRLPLLDRKGGDWSEWPEDLRVREFPAALMDPVFRREYQGEWLDPSTRRLASPVPPVKS